MITAAGVAEQHRRPDFGVKDDVVLTHEVIGLRIAGCLRLPPRTPGLGIPAALRPLHGRRQVANDGVEPNVEALVETVAPPLEGNRDAQVVARDGAQLEVVQQVGEELQDVGAPLRLLLQPAAPVPR